MRRMLLGMALLVIGGCGEGAEGPMPPNLALAVQEVATECRRAGGIVGLGVTPEDCYPYHAALARCAMLGTSDDIYPCKSAVRGDARRWRTTTTPTPREAVQ